jgi:hypothetical protein
LFGGREPSFEYFDGRGQIIKGCGRMEQSSQGAEGEGQCLMKQSELFRQNAENCTQMVEAARGEPAYNRYERMETAWLALDEELDWLDDERSPVGPEDGLQAPQLPLLERVVPRHASVGR